MREYTCVGDPPATVRPTRGDVIWITERRVEIPDLLRVMDGTLGWARVWFAAKRDDPETPLRQGAWYPVVTSGASRAVLEVLGQRVAVEQDALEVRAKRPDRFTVVYRTHDDPNPARGTRADVGRRYGVCPMCATRVPFRGGVIPAVATCPKCRHEGIVAWWETG